MSRDFETKTLSSESRGGGSPRAPFVLRKYFMLGIAVVALVGMGVAGGLKALSGNRNAAPDGKTVPAPAGGPGTPAGPGGGEPSLVADAEAGLRRFSSRLEALGTAQAIESVVISANQTETIARIFFESGQKVAKGAPLIELAGTEEAADLLDAQVALANARTSSERFSTLAAQGIAPQARADDAKAALERAEAQVLAIRARQADRLIRAPFAGVVGLRDTSPGALARPGDALATLDDLSVMKVDFNLPERYLSAVRRGTRIEARSEAWPGVVFRGEIAEIDSRIDEATRSLRARAKLPNGDNRLKPGMLLVIEVGFSGREALAVPESAIILDADKSYVLALDATGDAIRTTRREVTTGEQQDGFVEVISGLKAGDRFVAEGGNRVRPGEIVRTTPFQGSAAPHPGTGDTLSTGPGNRADSVRGQ